MIWYWLALGSELLVKITFRFSDKTQPMWNVLSGGLGSQANDTHIYFDTQTADLAFVWLLC